jgi:hypothetical protein
MWLYDVSNVVRFLSCRRRSTRIRNTVHRIVLGNHAVTGLKRPVRTAGKYSRLLHQKRIESFAQRSVLMRNRRNESLQNARCAVQNFWRKDGGHDTIALLNAERKERKNDPMKKGSGNVRPVVGGLVSQSTTTTVVIEMVYSTSARNALRSSTGRYVLNGKK